MPEPLAHSARGPSGPQTYRCHVDNVVALAVANARAATRYLCEGADGFVSCVQAAARFHDLGKLDQRNQAVLCASPRERLPVNHVDAGVAHLLSRTATRAALLAHAHHMGLCSIPEEMLRREQALRDDEIRLETDRLLPEYVADDVKWIGAPRLGAQPAGQPSGLTLRFALSCLVDADHGDSSAHEHPAPALEPPAVRWGERVTALDRYVERLGRGKPRDPRGQVRAAVYADCRRAPVEPRAYACDSPVGTGKTTAVMAHLLQAAQASALRHILVVLPYTNIIRQSVRVYREALTLPGEDPEAVVAEHHHQADFSSVGLRGLSTLWRAPVTVTTAVQFFETLAGNHPARVRKLHELPGSAIFLDEAHAAIPASLWPQTWLWLSELLERWTCHLVLASGSLVRFWELPEFVSPPVRLPDLVQDETREAAVGSERVRIVFRRREEAADQEQLQNLILDGPGPRLVILNTVQSAAVVADALARIGQTVLHLSTALCPRDRDRVVERIARLLQFGELNDWTLVATSCVEAGLDFSFRSGFRESCSTASLIQVSGRVNRHGAEQNGVVWDFRIVPDGLLTLHPGFSASRRALDELFREGMIGASAPTDLVTRAMRSELLCDADCLSGRLQELEMRADFPAVADQYRVIPAQTCTVVVDPELRERLARGRPVTPLDLLRGSVQLWSTRIAKLGLRALEGFGAAKRDALYDWPHKYDPDFLGYMAGVLQLVRQDPGDLIV